MLSKFQLPFAVMSFAALSILTAPYVVAQNAQTHRAKPLIAQPIDAAKLHRLAGNTRGEATAENDRGKVVDTLAMDHMILQLQRSPDHEEALKTFIDQQHDSASPNFHKWLTPEEFGAQFGAAPQDIDTVTKWLRASGFTVNTVYPNGMTIDFSGTAGHVAKAFHTEIHKLSVNGANHIANMSDPQIPKALAPVVAGIVSLHDFRPRKMHKAKAQYTATDAGGHHDQVMTPADLATIYDLNPAFAAGYTGQGQTIAVVEDSNLYRASDWSTFRSTFGLSTYTSGTLTTLHPAPPTGKTNCPDPGASGDDGEATLDAEWASAAAPNATIQVASCGNSTTTSGVLIAFQNSINTKSGAPQVISVSYGNCEALSGTTTNAAINSLYQQAVSQGISVFVSTGDSGPAGCDGDFGSFVATHGISVSAWASTPYNVAVGGTDFGDTFAGTNSTYWSSTNTATFGSALSYIPEIPWNDSCAGSLSATYSGYAVGYGTNGFCGSTAGQNFVQLIGGGGGPSGCATGTPSAFGVVSGTCQGYAKPTWQMGAAGNPNDGVRDIPDVSLFAALGTWGHYYVTCFSDTSNGGAPCTGAPISWYGAGGTSFASPILAGIQALVNQKMGGAQGNPNPVYYKLAASTVASSVFHPTAKGDSAQNCSGTINCFGIGFVGRGRSASQTIFDGNGALSTTADVYTPAFAANGLWNFATGIGSVDGYNLILNWSKGQ